MDEKALCEALEGLYAYDGGSLDSGIKDEALRQKCKEYIKSLPLKSSELVPRLWLSRLVRDMWLSEEALEQGYGIEDALKFLQWLQDEMDVPI